jgi:predicted O-methyltransferase YrrM
MSNYPNWFEGQRYNFEQHLLHLKGQSNLRFLQIGVYTGDASIWLCENILTDETSFLYDVDTWSGSNEKEHEAIDFEKVLEYYKERIAALQSTVCLRMTSDDFFNQNKTIDFDFIYIDGDHTAEQVTKDAKNAWLLLKPGGIMAFDDYLWGTDLESSLTPKPAIDNFLSDYAGRYWLLSQDYQVWIQKNATV